MHAVDVVRRYWEPAHLREHPDGQVTWLHRLMYTTAICIGPDEDGGYRDSWCYATEAAALDALKDWNPLETKEPEGWHRHPVSGRRRPEGDATREYVNP